MQEQLLEFKLEKEAELQKIIRGSMIVDKSTSVASSGSEEALRRW